MPGLGTILPLQLYLSNTPTGSRHLPPSTRNQESETKTTQRQGRHVYRCRGGETNWLAQIMGFCTGPWPKVHRWPQKFGESDYLPTPCLLPSHPIPCLHAHCVRRKMFQETLSFREQSYKKPLQQQRSFIIIFINH